MISIMDNNSNPNNQIKKWRVPSKLTGNLFIYGRPGCLDENTRIYILENGKDICVKSLKELPNKFKVISFDISRQKRVICDAYKIDSGIKKCYEIQN